MTKHFGKNVSATLFAMKRTVLPRLVIAVDFIAVVAISIIVLWLVVVLPVNAFAQEPQQPTSTAPRSDAPQVIHASTIDIDRDGTLDRAVLVRNPKTQDADLYIYRKAGGLTPIPARDFTRAPTSDEDAAENRATQALMDKSAADPTPVRPDLVFASVADGRVFDFEKHGTSLVIMTGCGGCPEGTDTKITIVHRNGQYVIGGYSRIWAKADRSGRCDINFMTGKASIARDRGKAQTLKGRFVPVRLAEWKKDNPPQACSI